MNRVLTIISLLIAILVAVTSCEDRSLGKPDINVTLSVDTLYTLENYAGNISNIKIELKSDYIDVIKNKRIDIHYNGDLANVITNATGTGNQSYFVTDANGKAEGYVFAREKGNLQIKFTVSSFKDVTITKNIKILEPFIYKMVADPPSIPADDISLSEIKVYTRPPVSGQHVELSIDWGSLISQAVTTDANGEAITWVKSDRDGFGTITAKLVEYPENSRSIIIEYSLYEE